MIEATADDIRQQMQLTRRRVRAEVSEVVDGARRFADWRFYPRQFPWATVGAVAAVAFAAIPRRHTAISPDSETLERLLRDHQLLLEPRSSSEPARKGVAAALLATAGTALLRFGLNYAGRQLGRRFDDSLIRGAGPEGTG